MRIATLISRYLIGLIFFVFGLNGFLQFLPMPELPEPAMDAMTKFSIPLKRDPGVVFLEHNIMLPHELFSVLYHQHHSFFTRKILGGSAANVERFWRDMAAHPAYVSRPAGGSCVEASLGAIFGERHRLT